MTARTPFEANEVSRAFQDFDSFKGMLASSVLSTKIPFLHYMKEGETAGVKSNIRVSCNTYIKKRYKQNVQA